MKRLKDLLGIGTMGLIFVGLAIVTWVFVIVLSGAGWNPFPWQWNFAGPGAFGDSFGPFSAFMASVAALSAIAAFRSQASELARAQARQAADDERQLVERARLLSREENLDRRSRQSAFEGTFFRLLDAFRSIVSQIDILTSQGVTKDAQDAFQSILGWTERSANGAGWNLESAWQATINKYSNDLNHYFRFMYHIVKFVDDSEVDDKYFYVRLLRAMLSDSEIVLLGLNCEYGEGRPRFKELVERYALLHNISEKSKSTWFNSTTLSPAAFDIAPPE